MAGTSTFPLLAKQSLKKPDRPVPAALTVAGLPATRGGNALAVKAAHFFATSALGAAETSPTAAPTPMRINAACALPTISLVIMMLSRADPLWPEL
jgi:hypothetical protein